MAHSFSNVELESYLDEALPLETMTRIERALAGDRVLQDKLAAINARRDAGVHSLGEIWRRHRLSCPTREQLGSHLLGVLSNDATDYIRFHLEVVGCRACLANLHDLAARQTDEPAAVDNRRRKYFQSSAGHLKRAN